MMVGFPLLMYYLWICVWFYDGFMVYPNSFQDIFPFLEKMWIHVKEVGYFLSTDAFILIIMIYFKDASPNLYAWKVYSGFFIFQLAIAFVLPGYKQEGLPVPSLGYKTLTYNCNALVCFYATAITAATLHLTSIFRLTNIIDNYGHLMTVAMIYGFAWAFGLYAFTVARGKQLRMSGNLFYDVFMGASLNPRIGPIDLKMWAEVRIPWNIVFFLAISGACKQYETYGYVTPVRPFFKKYILSSYGNLTCSN